MSDDSTDTADGTSASMNRRRVLRNLGVLGVSGGFGTGTAAARGPPAGRGNGGNGNGNGNGNGGGPGGPPEKCSCPEDSFLAKYEVVSDGDGCRFEHAEGDDVLDIVEWTGTDGTDCEPMSVSYRAPGYRLDSACAFGGTDTDSDDVEPDDEGVYTFEPDLTNPGGQRAAISNLVVCGSADDDPEPDPECGALELRYECTTYSDERASEEIVNWRRTGTRFRVADVGDGDGEVGYGSAVTNDRNTYVPVGDRTVEAGPDESFVSDSSAPTRAIVFWAADAACADRLELETWGEFKQRRGFADLDAFYDGPSPANAPTDLDDTLYVADADALPQGSVPDADVSPEQYPSLSDEAEAAGWITCEKQA